MEQGFAASELWSVVWHCIAVVLRVGSNKAALEGDPQGEGHPTAEPDWNLLSPQGRSCGMAGHLPWTLLHILPSDLPTVLSLSTSYPSGQRVQGAFLEDCYCPPGREGWAGQ